MNNNLNNNNSHSTNCANPVIDATPGVDASPGLNDILLGKGHYLNPGNLWLNQHVLEHKAEYQQMSRDCKGPFLKRIIQSVHDTGRHFYMKDDKGDKWNVIKIEDRSVTSPGNNIIQKSIATMLNRRGRGEESSVIIHSNVIPNIKQRSYNLRHRHASPSPNTNNPNPNSTQSRNSNDEVTCWIEQDFIKENMDLLPDIWALLDDLFTHPFRLPDAGDSKGIVVTVDSPRGNPPLLNINRPSYLRNQFVKVEEKRSCRGSKNTWCYPYGIGSGIGSVGTPPW